MVFERMANLADRVAEGFLRAIADTPDGVQQMVTGDQLAGVVSKTQQHFCRFRRQVTGPVRTGDLALERLNEQLAEMKAV